MRALLTSRDVPDIASDIDLHAHYAADWVSDGGVRVNFVSSIDGSATARGLSRGLQTPGDNRIFRALRDLADVVLVGAATAATEKYRPSSPSVERREIRARYGFQPAPAIAVMSSTLNLDLSSKLFTHTSRDSPTLIITGSAAPVTARNDVIDAAGGGAALQLLEAPSESDGGVNFGAAIAHLNELGYRRILCEGGPRLFSAGIESRAVDELCLSVSPFMVGPGGPRIVAGTPWPEDLVARLELTGLLLEEDSLFCRYRVRRQRTTPATD